MFFLRAMSVVKWGSAMGRCNAAARRGVPHMGWHQLGVAASLTFQCHTQLIRTGNNSRANAWAISPRRSSRSCHWHDRVPVCSVSCRFLVK